MKKRWLVLFFIFALLALSLLAQESPAHVFKTLLLSPFSSKEALSDVLVYFVPTMFTGLGVLLCLQLGLFNLGAEGQLYLGAVGGFAFAQIYPSFWFSLLGSILVSGLWGLCIGAIKSFRGVHEVVLSLLSNFVAIGFTTWVVLYVFKNPESQNPETFSLPIALQTQPIAGPFTWGFFLSLFTCGLVFFLIYKTWLGFRFRTIGANITAAQTAQIPTRALTCAAFFLSASCAGLAGFNEVFFHSYKIIDGFSPGFGFTGLAVALMSQGKPLRFLLASGLLACLQKSSLDLEIETDKITKDFVLILQALFLLAMSLPVLIKKREET